MSEGGFVPSPLRVYEALCRCGVPEEVHEPYIRFGFEVWVLLLLRSVPGTLARVEWMTRRWAGRGLDLSVLRVVVKSLFDGPETGRCTSGV
jgi:hypothetical protein